MQIKVQRQIAVSRFYSELRDSAIQNFNELQRIEGEYIIYHMPISRSDLDDIIQFSKTEPPQTMDKGKYLNYLKDNYVKE